MNYQWLLKGVAISGTTNASLLLGNLQFTNAGLYSVVVANAYGSVTNGNYQVVVNPANATIGTCPMIYLTGTAGYSYAIQTSTNLANSNSWGTVTNIILSTASTIWTDTGTDTSKPQNPLKYYRVIAGQ